MLLQPSKPEGVSMDMTPIIDMVFNLLIFFLVATTFHQTEREMQIALPEARASGPITTALRDIVINVDAQGRMIVTGRAMAPDDLGALIRQAVAANPAQKVSVRGDRTTAYANVALALDICKGAGVSEPYLETIPVN